MVAIFQHTFTRSHKNTPTKSHYMHIQVPKYINMCVMGGLVVSDKSVRVYNIHIRVPKYINMCVQAADGGSCCV